MSKCQYIIEGRLYNKETDLVSKILTLTAVFDLSAEIEKTENGYLIEIEADKEKLLGFEPELFKKLASLMEIRLYTKKEPKLPKKSVTNDNKPFKICARLLRQDKIIAIKGNNGFHLVCSASKSKAVRALRALISQPDKPLTIMYKDIRKARHFVLLSSKEEALLTSDTKPFVVARLRNLHRLEKAKYKHKLTPLINTLNQRITLSLPHNGLYERLFNEIEFPLVSIDANIDNYRDNLEYILESDEEIQAPNKREVLQVVYGKTQSIEPKIEIKEKAFEVCLDYEKSTIGNFKFKPFNLLFTDTEIKKLHKSWNKNRVKENSLLYLFDAITSLSGELHQKSFINQSVMLAEDKHEACEEHLFDYKIIDNEIEIEINLQNSKLNYLSSTLTNTIATIITQIAKEQDLDVHLSGELFDYKNLSELTIEKLEDEDIKAILS